MRRYGPASDKPVRPFVVFVWTGLPLRRGYGRGRQRGRPTSRAADALDAVPQREPSTTTKSSASWVRVGGHRPAQAHPLDPRERRAANRVLMPEARHAGIVRFGLRSGNKSRRLAVRGTTHRAGFMSATLPNSPGL